MLLVADSRTVHHKEGCLRHCCDQIGKLLGYSHKLNISCPRSLTHLQNSAPLTCWHITCMYQTLAHPLATVMDQGSSEPHRTAFHAIATSWQTWQTWQQQRLRDEPGHDGSCHHDKASMALTINGSGRWGNLPATTPAISHRLHTVGEAIVALRRHS